MEHLSKQVPSFYEACVLRNMIWLGAPTSSTGSFVEILSSTSCLLCVFLLVDVNPSHLSSSRNKCTNWSFAKFSSSPCLSGVNARRLAGIRGLALPRIAFDVADNGSICVVCATKSCPGCMPRWLKSGFRVEHVA